MKVKENTSYPKRTIKVPAHGALYVFKFRHASGRQYSQGILDAGKKSDGWMVHYWYNTYGDQDRLNLLFSIDQTGYINYVSDRNTFGDLSIRKVSI